MDNLALTRLLRTDSSERFLVRRSGTDIAAVDLHYLDDGTVHGTLVVFDEARFEDNQVGNLLTWIDEVLLPHVDLASGKLIFTVVVGRVLGAFSPDKEMAGATLAAKGE